MTTTANHPSGLPEQEPTSPAAVVLCDGATWVNTAMGWESLTQWLGAWGGLRDFAAEKGGATLFNLADLPADLPMGLTEVKKDAIRSAWATLDARGHDVSAGVLRNAFPEAFADDRVTVTWESGDPEEKLAELLRVTEMEGAHAVAERDGVTYSGPVKVRRDAVETLALGDAGAPYHIWLYCPGWTITVTAPKPADPTCTTLPEEHDMTEQPTCTTLPEEHDMTKQPTCTTMPDGTKEWSVNDKLHRVDGPAVEYADGSKQWSVNDKLHRTDGPAVEYADGTKEWWLNDKRHRTDGPAIEWADGTKEWWLDDKRHRADGPAVEAPDGYKAWWLDGEPLTEAEHAKRTA